VVFRPKASGTNSIQYDIQTTPDFRTLELSTTVTGKVWGATQVAAEAFLQTVLAGLNLTGGKLMANSRQAHNRQGPAAGGSAAVLAFESMDFTVTYISLFTGIAGILESEVSEDLLYSGTRNVEKPVPDGASILQQCGTTLGQRTVVAHCRATTKTAADAWVRTIRTTMLASVSGKDGTAREEPPRIVTSYKFLPQVGGIPAGTGANVTLYDTTGTFSEKIPQLVFA